MFRRNETLELSMQGHEICVLGSFDVAMYPTTPYPKLSITSLVIMHVKGCYRQSALSGEWRKGYMVTCTPHENLWSRSAAVTHLDGGEGGIHSQEQKAKEVVVKASPQCCLKEPSTIEPSLCRGPKDMKCIL